MRLTGDLVAMIMVIIAGVCRSSIVMAGLAMIPVAVIENADLCHAAAIAEIAAHDAKYLRPTQREERKANEPGIWTAGHVGS